jgi:hypothetical protein
LGIKKIAGFAPVKSKTFFTIYFPQTAIAVSVLANTEMNAFSLWERLVVGFMI